MKYEKNKHKLLQVRVSDEDLKALDAIAVIEKRTRSDVIRLLIASRGLSYGEKETKEKICI